MIYDGNDGDIINQYVVFTRICSEQIAEHGRKKEAVMEAIRICKDKNILKEYLEGREKEVTDIMMMLYDKETIMKEFLESEIYEARQEAGIATAREMLKDNEPMEKIMKYSRLPQSVILELQKEQNQQSI